jgi:hypothetical protein
MIRWHPLLLGIMSAMAFGATPLAGKVTVLFVDPASFTDLGGLESDPSRNLSDLGTYLRSLGDRYLPPRVALRIEVLDVSLAGRSRQPSRTTWPVRSMTGEADWPRFEVRYTLETDENTSAPVEETVVDRNYLRRLEWRYQSLTLPYEMRTLEEWFKQRFGERVAQGPLSDK